MISCLRNTVLVPQRPQPAAMNSLLLALPRFPSIPCLRPKSSRVAPAAAIKRTMDNLRVLLAGHLPGPTIRPVYPANDGMKVVIPEIPQPHPPQSVQLSSLRSRPDLCQRRGLVRLQLAPFPKNELTRSPLDLCRRKELGLNPLTGLNTHREAAGRRTLLLIQDRNVMILLDHQHILPVSLCENPQLDVTTAVMVVMIVGRIVALAMIIPRDHANFIPDVKSLLFYKMTEILNPNWRRLMHQVVLGRRSEVLRYLFLSLFLFPTGHLHLTTSLQAYGPPQRFRLLKTTILFLKDQNQNFLTPWMMIPWLIRLT